MTERLRDYTHLQGWDLQSKSTLLAVSGGMDSILMAHLFHAAGFPFALAHVNFKLRAADADLDAAFVESLAASMGVPFYYTEIDTLSFSKVQKKSIQVAARDFRYAWFQNIIDQNGFYYLATAHHLDDSIETMLFNLSKGTGLKGLHGIPKQNGPIIRPLLFMFRQDIENIVHALKLPFRQDFSNFEDKYSRNYIRNRVIPTMEKLNPGFKTAMIRLSDHILEAEILYEEKILELKEKWVKVRGDGLEIDKLKLMSHPAQKTLLFHWIGKFGFNSKQLSQILSPETQTGAWFYSQSHQLLVDRAHLIVGTQVQSLKETFAISENDIEIHLLEGILYLKKGTNIHSFENLSPNEACLDFDKLQFPLRLRRWRQGDTFQPFGMGGKSQKLKNFFTNQKFSRIQKDQVWLLTSGDDICWVVGHRIDNRFKIDAHTAKVLEMNWTSHIH